MVPVQNQDNTLRFVESIVSQKVFFSYRKRFIRLQEGRGGLEPSGVGGKAYNPRAGAKNSRDAGPSGSPYTPQSRHAGRAAENGARPRSHHQASPHRLRHESPRQVESPRQRRDAQIIR